tara:strand:+ start:3487 stop:3777 length:291 start_codon:yes stop_codon:yes gene_type:complete
MMIQGLVLNCPNCDSWYTGKERDVIKNARFDEVTFLSSCLCTSCLSNGSEVELKNAYECHIQTPYQALREEFIRRQISALEHQIQGLENDLEECTV